MQMLSFRSLFHENYENGDHNFRALHNRVSLDPGTEWEPHFWNDLGANVTQVAYFIREDVRRGRREANAKID